MASSSSGSSQSTSSSYLPDYPQSGFLQSIAQYAGQLGDAVYNWGQQQYGKTSNITDQNINNYLTTSAQALQNANSDEERYQALFQPEENQLVADANSYNSTARQQHEMGRAEASAGRAMDAGRQNHIRELQSYGIDPSSGRYDELDRADQLMKSATQAAAGQQAYENTAATGRQLRADAIQVGQRYPGQITNEQNTALQGIAGAENSNLANANTGVALENAANQYLQTASSLKYPPLGSKSQSTSQQNSVSSDSGGGSSGGGKSPQDQQQSPQQGGGGISSSGGGGGGGGGGSSSDSSDPFGDGGGDFGYYGGTNGDGDFSGDLSSPDYGWDYTGGGGDVTNGDGGFSGDVSYDNSDLGGGTEMSAGDSYGGGYDYSGGDSYASADYSDYARGGPVGGGHVPASMSPSRGARVDDIPASSPRGPAHLNANEFVIPQDVALWKGQEFFQKLIADARKNNAVAAAKPQFKGAQHVAR